MHEFEEIFGKQTLSSEAIQYELLYNYTNDFEDFVEVFDQRLQEHNGLLENRFELFFEALKGNGPWLNNIIDVIPAAGSIIDEFTDWNRAKTIEYLSNLTANPPTLDNYLEHQTRIDNWIIEGKKFLFVAHSQGNLFANNAYDYARSKAHPGSVKAIHIAPASPTLRGEYTLADSDLVINGLRLWGAVPDNTTSIPNYFNRPAGANNQKDILGHGLLEIYLNSRLGTFYRIANQVNAALNSLTTPPAQAASGFFTVTLTWNGSGDVDLHVYEPDATKVYYGNKRGNAGYLDVDNTRANGPEHYYASCDKGKLQMGRYHIAISNFNRADGRIATVQVASFNEGVLGTRSVTLAKPTGSISSFNMFDIFVEQNVETGKYSTRIE